MTSPTQSRRQGRHIGPTMELEPLILDLAPGRTTPSGGTYQNLGGTSFLFESESGETTRVADVEKISHLERLLGSNIPLLVSIYTKVVHPSLPIVGADQLARYYESGIRTWNPALLSSVCTVSETWLASSETRNGPQIPSSAALENLAFAFFTQALSRPSLPTIQAGLLLMQRPNIDSKTLNTQLIDAAYELGLQLDCSSWSISDSEKRLRKRLAWALYMQDKWCSLIHGRPSAISSSNWIVKPLEEDDFDTDPDSSVESTGQDIFMYMASLTEILATVLDKFYTPRAMYEVQEAAQSGTRLILDRAKPTQIRLKEWYTNIPAHLKLDANTHNNTPSGNSTSATSSTQPTSSVGYLHLAYYATEITLHRCIIRSLSASSTPSTTSASLPSPLTDPYVAHVCRAAAKTRLISAMDFVNRLRCEHWSAFWYFPSRTAFALVGAFGALLRATAPGQEEADFYADRLREYRWTLFVSTRHATFLHYAVESLDDAESLLVNLPAKPSTREIAEAQVIQQAERAQLRANAQESQADEEEEGEDDEDIDMDDSGSSVKSEVL